MPAGRKKYTIIYRIYRRMRYLHYIKKLRKHVKQERVLADKLAERERNSILKEQRKSDMLSDKQKRIKERTEFQQAKKELKEEIGQNAEGNLAEVAERKALEKKERNFRKYKRRRLIKFYTRVCRKNTIRSLKVFNPKNLPILLHYIHQNRKQTKNFGIIAIHSTFLFTAAYFMIFLIGLLVSSISGLFFEYKSVIYYYEVLWLVKPSQWFGDSVKMIYSSPPLLAGIIAVFLAIIFSYIRTDKGHSKLFILWSMLHGFNGFFGSLLIGSLFGRGFGYAIVWSYISDTEKVVYSIVSLTALFLLGIFTTKSFLITANSYFPKLENNKQRYFIWAQVIIPFLLGNAMIGAIMLPKLLLFDMTVSLCLAIAIAPVAIGYRFIPSLYFEEEEIKIRLRWKIIFYPLLFLMLYRIILGVGIPMG